VSKQRQTKSQNPLSKRLRQDNEQGEKLCNVSRERNLEIIKVGLTKTFNGEIVSALVYGSTLLEDFNIGSDYDVLLTVKNPDMSFLKKLRELKESLMAQLCVVIDFNIQSEKETPNFRLNAFWHNNRSFIIQKEMALYGHALIGENPFSLSNVSQNDIELEAVRLANSFVYQTRKTILNKELSTGNKIEIIKFCLYSTYIALAFVGEFPEKRKGCFELFPKYFETSEKPSYFFELKRDSYDMITLEHIEKAYRFLAEVDAELFKRFNHKSGS
jgi:predicted nucleotidyltransferase